MAVQRIALFSDVHGNLAALEAVLAQIDESGISTVYCLGDLVGYGPDPRGVIERLKARQIVTIMGNYDEGIAFNKDGCGCFYATDQARIDGAASFAFTSGSLSSSDRQWLASLPRSVRLDVDGVRVLLVHGSPRKNNEYLLLDRTDRQLIRLAEESGADCVCVGHVHIPYHRAMTTDSGMHIHYLSCGSVGKPKDGDPRAAWIELVIGDQHGVRQAAKDDAAIAQAGVSAETFIGVRVHRADYDLDAVTGAMAAAGLPRSLQDALRKA